jgi:signal transduction histidine kinase
MATVIDISERKKAELERDDLRRRIVDSQEQERLRLAHELHDRTGQELSAAMLELKGIEAQTNEGGRDRIRRLRQRLDQMGKSLHHVAWELRPASFDELGIASALADYISDWGERYGIAADFHCRDAKVDELSEEVRTTIYRVVQEALTNVAKHAAEAESISVVIDRDDAMLRLTIEDDGRGFDMTLKAEPGNRGSGLGHAGMRERLALIGGQIEFESSPSVGTTIFVRIPLATREAVA